MLALKKTCRKPIFAGMPCHERCNIRCTKTSFDASAQRTWSNRYPGMKIIGCCLGKEKPWSCQYEMGKKLMKGDFEVWFIITCLCEKIRKR